MFFFKTYVKPQTPSSSQAMQTISLFLPLKIISRCRDPLKKTDRFSRFLGPSVPFPLHTVHVTPEVLSASAGVFLILFSVVGLLEEEKVAIGRCHYVEQKNY